MQMNCKKYDENQHYKLIESWWIEREGAAPQPDMLSHYGWISFFNQRPIAALWLYPILGSKVAWVGWPIANPDSGKLERNLALDTVFDKIENTAKEMGYKYIWTTSGVNPVQNRLKERGYKQGDSNITQYWKIQEVD